MPQGLLGKVVMTVVLLIILTCAFLACFSAIYIRGVILPEAHLDAGDYTTELASTIYYQDESTGEDVELRSLYGAVNREWVAYADIPQTLAEATIAIEDKRFESHNGVDWLRTIKAAWYMFTGTDIQGGSTITQQLIKNMTDYDDVTVKRKVLEIFRALDFDKTHIKDTIKEMSLNYIYLGNGCYGVTPASNYYFGKDVSELDLAESASLIAITNNPSVYDPYRNDGVRNKERQTLILNAMCEQGMITEEERDAAIAQELVYEQKVDSAVNPETVFSWYEEQVISDVVNDLVETYNYSKTVAQDMVTRGGLHIYSCLEPDVQATVEEIYTNRANLDVTSSSGQKLESAIVIVNADGNVVALAGAMGEKTANLIWNNASQAVRQPGSALKPLSVYTPALELGVISPSGVFDDTAVRTLNGSAWPSNSYGTYTGRMTLAQAVARSSNAVAVRVLEKLTPQVSFDFLENKFGFTTLVNGRTSNGQYVSDIDTAPLSMGGLTDGVTVLEMAAAFSAFPRDGVYITPRTYTKVVDSNGKVLLDNTQRESKAIMKETTAWYMNDLLTGVVTSSNGTGTYAKISGMTVAGKTGSTNTNNDRWFVGYTPYYTAAVWTGYNTPERIYYSKGSKNPALDMWKLVMEEVHENLPSKSFNEPAGLKTVTYCLDSGLKPSQACTHDVRGSRVVTGHFFAGDEPTEYCDLHVDVQVCTSAPLEVSGLYYLAGDYCASHYVNGEETSTVKTISVLNYDRDSVSSASDSVYLLSYLRAHGTCPVHTGAVTVTDPDETEDPEGEPDTLETSGEPPDGDSNAGIEATQAPVAQSTETPPLIGQEAIGAMEPSG